MNCRIDNDDNMILTPKNSAFTHILTFGSVPMSTNVAAETKICQSTIGYALLMSSKGKYNI